jgi:hypothetical protein
VGKEGGHIIDVIEVGVGVAGSGGEDGVGGVV